MSYLRKELLSVDEKKKKYALYIQKDTYMVIYYMEHLCQWRYEYNYINYSNTFYTYQVCGTSFVICKISH